MIGITSIIKNIFHVTFVEFLTRVSGGCGWGWGCWWGDVTTRVLKFIIGESTDNVDMSLCICPLHSLSDSFTFCDFHCKHSVRNVSLPKSMNTGLFLGKAMNKVLVCKYLFVSFIKLFG